MRKRMLLGLIGIVAGIGTLQVLHAQSTPWVTAYYAGWSQGWVDNGVLPSSQIDYSAVTHIIHFALVPHGDGTLDDQSNSVHENNAKALITKAHAAGTKVLICVGGWGTNDSFRDATSLLTRSTFIDNLVNHMVSRGYDGIDIDWEPLDILDAVQYTAFITELRARLDKITPRPLLTVACGTQSEIFKLVVNQFDQINIMTYDLSGAWPGWVPWHNAPLYDGGFNFPSTGRPVPSIDGMVESVVDGGVTAKKIGIGIDFYGYVWSGGSGTSTGGVTQPRQTWTSPPQVRANVPYYTLMQDYYKPEYYRWDSTAEASYLSIDNPGSANDQFISYDNEMTCKKKLDYVKAKGIGGVIIWELGGGMLPSNFSNRNRLLQTIKKIITNNEKAPSTAALTSPPTASQGISLKTTLHWNPQSDASWYRLQFSTDSLFSSPMIDQSWLIDNAFSPNRLLAEATYYWRVQSSNAFGTSAWSAVSYFKTAADSILPPWWEFTGNTGSNATVIIPSTIIPKVGKNPINDLDLVGIFFRRNDSLICAGYSRWQHGNNVPITAWGDNSQTAVKDGFAPGDTMYFKLWIRKPGREYDATPAYASGGPVYKTDSVYILQSLDALPNMKQSISLEKGWNMISSYIKPVDSSLQSVTKSLQPNLIIMKDGAGNVFAPDSNINTIGRWEPKNGYQVYMRNAGTLTMIGEAIVPEAESISLSAGWNLAAYLRSSPMPPEDALGTIAPALVLMKDNDGNIFWPEFKINTIQTMNPGRGYKMYLKQNDILVYPPNTSEPEPISLGSKTAAAKESFSGEHYIPAVSKTGNSSVLLVQSQELADGDEVGVWSSKNILIGAGKALAGTCAAILWGKDSITNNINGAVEGEELSLRLWKRSTQHELKLLIGNLTDGISGASHPLPLTYSSESALIAATTAVPVSHYLDQNFPNPFNNSTTISFGIAEPTHVTLEIFNSVGQKVAILIKDKEYPPGQYQIPFNNRKFASGMYLCRLLAGNFSEIKKMVLLK